VLTDLTLSQIMRNASQQRRAASLAPLNAALQTYQINNLLRTAAFLAQLAHESGELQFMEEIWGPTEAQKRYEPPSTLATRLGNTDAGDGKRFKGRGPIQITGRANYRRYGELLGIDLIAHPERAALPEIGFAIAGLYWQRNSLNALADAGNFREITQRINGGQNGAAQREAFYEHAKLVLADLFPEQMNASTESEHADAITDAIERGFESVLTSNNSSAVKSAAAATANKKKTSEPARVFNVRPDTLDFRDLMYVASLVEVPTHISLGDYLEHSVPILDQGTEGACTGFGLATVANYLLVRRRVLPDKVPVSPRMCYELARRYDEWPGEDYSGSSARGAMKGWHKHGICSESEWRYELPSDDGLTESRSVDARRRPLGAYFRVNHKDVVAMHSAIAEVGVLYATCVVHSGWQNVDAGGVIEQTEEILGGHAFAIVAYDEEGFWIQNSWGPTWGRRGFARISYDDWLANGTDVWVARLGAPVTLRQSQSAATAHASVAGQSSGYSFADLRPHIVSVGNDGRVEPGGDYGHTPGELARIFAADIPRIAGDWPKPRILLYAHGGLTSEQSAVQRLGEYRPALLDSHVYPLAFIWRTDYWTSVSNILSDAVRRRRPEGLLDSAKDFMLDRLDDALEPVARTLSGKAVWDEMKENAFAASAAGGAAVLVADHLARLAEAMPGLEIHLVGHSAGSILLAPMVKLLNDRGLTIESCALWAPACSVKLFELTYLPALKANTLKDLALFVLREKAELDDDCARIYNKSLLYLVSNAFEKRVRIPGFRDGIPILGMAKFIDAKLRKTLDAAGVDIILAPNNEPCGSPNASQAQHHGDFDDDLKTVQATFARIASPIASAPSKMLAGVGVKTLEQRLEAEAGSARQPAFQRSSASLREQRQQIDRKTR